MQVNNSEGNLPNRYFEGIQRYLSLPNITVQVLKQRKRVKNKIYKSNKIVNNGTFTFVRT